MRGGGGEVGGCSSSPTQSGAVKIATYNATSWRSILSYARVTSATVILGQEHHLREGEVDDASRSAKRLGWLTA